MDGGFIWIIMIGAGCWLNGFAIRGLLDRRYEEQERKRKIWLENKISGRKDNARI